MTNDLLESVKDGVAVLTLNRPDRLNALSVAMLDALLERVARHLASFGHGLDVAARAEAAPGAREHDDADVRIGRETRERFEHRDAHRLRQRVEPIGPVHGEHGHAVLQPGQQVLGAGIK